MGEVLKLHPIHPVNSLHTQYRRHLDAYLAFLRTDTLAVITHQNNQAINIAWLLHAINNAFQAHQLSQNAQLAIATAFIHYVSTYHKQNFIKKTNKTLGFDISKHLADDTQFDELINAAIQENVALIKSLPSELYKQIKEVVEKAFSYQGIDQSAIQSKLKSIITESLKGRFKVAHSRIKLITRDQTNKLIGKLTQLRHQQLGIDKYEWIGVDDSRERPSHVANNNRIFSYSNPPSTGNAGQAINCRCVGRGIITIQNYHRLKNHPLTNWNIAE